MRTQILRLILLAIGIAAICTGIFVVITGSGGVTGGRVASPSVDSELRFFAVFWIAYGAASLTLARHPTPAKGLVRAVALVMLGGGVARAIAWIDLGRPDSLFVVLMVIELLGPLGILALSRHYPQPP